MTIHNTSTAALVANAFDRRSDPVEDLGLAAVDLAVACPDMAAQFTRGSRLLVFGNGAGATDAQHVAVEFVHPVVAGRRALPALCLVSDAATLNGVATRTGWEGVYAHQITVLGRPGDIALGISSDGNCANVREGLRAARRMGLLTIALLGGDGGAVSARNESDHCLPIPSGDPHIVKEGHVTAYHLLWELVHVFFDAQELSRAHEGHGAEAPFAQLYGGANAPSVLDAVAGSVRQTVAEIVQLRRAVGVEQGPALAACAEQLADVFRAGGTLLAFGNGASSTDAQDLVHTFMEPPPPGDPLPALGLTNDVAVLTALSNDVGLEAVFAVQMGAFGRFGDAAVAISTKGDSPNVLAAINQAERMGRLTIGLVGDGRGDMAELSLLHHLFTVPSPSVQRVQEVQITLCHVLGEATRAALIG